MTLRPGLLAPLAGVRWGHIRRPWLVFELSGAEAGGVVDDHLCFMGQRLAQCVIDGERLVGLASASGGHLAKPASQLLDELALAVREDAVVKGRSPAAYAGHVIECVQEVARTDVFRGCLIGMSLCFLVAEDRTFLWRVGSSGTWFGDWGALRVLGADHRKAALVREGVVDASPIDTVDARLAQEASAVFYVQSPDGYEAYLTTCRATDVVLLLNEGAHPFGPLLSAPLTSRTLFSREAGWWHGLQSHGIVLAREHVDDIGWPGAIDQRPSIRDPDP